jgi:hypothetical protein
MGVFLIWLTISLLGLTLCPFAMSQDVEVLILDGTMVSGRLESLTSDQIAIAKPDGPTIVPSSSVATIRFASANVPPKSTVVLSRHKNLLDGETLGPSNPLHAER